MKTGVSLNVTITTITMRDITNSPIFLRLGSRMRGPEGVPIGALRRVIISNIACSNSASTLGSIISGIQFSNIEIACVKEDLRPAFVLQEVKGAEFFRVRATHAREAPIFSLKEAPIFSLKKVSHFSVTQSRPVADTVLEKVEEKKL